MDMQFYQAHLDRVSRSFAFCIAELEAPLRGWVSLNYLICRILDTVEDAPWESHKAQMRQFQRFDDFMKSPPSANEVSVWIGQFPVSIAEGEKLLLADAHAIFQDFHALDTDAKDVLFTSVESMSRGMQHFAEQKQSGHLRLQSLAQINQYCFFVAGVVGESLAKLLHLVDSTFSVPREKLLESHHFGLFLQKVNLLKDQAGDQEEGRHFISSRAEVSQSLLENAKKAFAFLESVPLSQRGFRLFCAWSLFLGLASLPWSERFFREGKVGKIPKLKAKWLLEQVRRRIESPEQLKSLFEEHWDHVRVTLVESLDNDVSKMNHQNDESTQWIQEAYLGPLTAREWQDLGMCS